MNTIVVATQTTSTSWPNRRAMLLSVATAAGLNSPRPDTGSATCWSIAGAALLDPDRRELDLVVAPDRPVDVVLGAVHGARRPAADERVGVVELLGHLEQE